MNLFKKKGEVASDEMSLEPLQYSVKAAAKLLSISERMVADLISRGKLTSHKLGGRRMVTHTALVKFVDTLSHEGV